MFEAFSYSKTLEIIMTSREYWNYLSSLDELLEDDASVN